MGSRRGFTLIELMIVVVIIGIIAALAIPRFMRASAMQEARQGLRSICTAQAQYHMDHGVYACELSQLSDGAESDVRLQEIVNRDGAAQPQNYEVTYVLFPCDAHTFTVTATSPRFEKTYMIGPEGTISTR